MTYNRMSTMERAPHFVQGALRALPLSSNLQPRQLASHPQRVKKRLARAPENVQNFRQPCKNHDGRRLCGSLSGRHYKGTHLSVAERVHLEYAVSDALVAHQYDPSLSAGGCEPPSHQEYQKGYQCQADVRTCPPAPTPRLRCANKSIRRDRRPPGQAALRSSSQRSASSMFCGEVS